MKPLSRTEALKRLPADFLARLRTQVAPSDLESILRGFGVSRNPVIRLNSLVASPQEIEKKLRSQNIILQKIERIPLAYEVKNRDEKALLKMPEAGRGEFILQGVSSQLPVLFLDPKSGEKIWDMCAAPGSKTSQIAAITAKNAKIIASELDQVRFQKLQNTLEIQKCTNCVQVFQTSAVTLGKQFENYFDAILLDVPCSAEGRIALSDPSSYRFWSQKNIIAHAKLQRQLFRTGVSALKFGGRLVYSTCTLAPEENEGMVSWALQEFGGEIVQIPLQSNLSFVKVKNNCLHIFPNEKAEGFFLAAFLKK